MADKKFTNKVGLDNLLDFDPINGILKYGSYEVFAKDVGVAPTRTEYNFDEWWKTQNAGQFGAAAVSMAPLTGSERERQLSAFEASVMDGSIGTQDKQGTADMYGSPAVKQSPVRNVQRLGPDSFAVETYNIPNTVDLVNKIGERAQGLKYQGDDGALLQNQSDAKSRRQGRASTVLSPSAATTVNA